MLQRTRRLLGEEHVGWKTRLRRGFHQAVRKYVPDPRDQPLTEVPVSKKSFEKAQSDSGMQIGLRPGQKIPDYLAERDRSWLVKQSAAFGVPSDEVHIHRTAEGLVHLPRGSREQYSTVDGSAANQKLPKASDYEVDEETMLLRRQLQMDNEVEYRKFIAERKRDELLKQDTTKRRLPHASDPNYDPFRSTPNYRPQDSKALAQWLKRQRESGRSASGLALNTKEGQERFYNEEKMSTQYHANPFSTRIEDPRGPFGKTQVEAYSPDSVVINGKEIIGSAIVTTNRYYHWNVSSFEEINERTLALLLHLYPVPDVLFIGTGRNLHMVDEELRIAFQKRGTVLHCLTTPNALSHFGMQMSVSRRTALAYVNPIPTNPYGRECFGDFIENDMFSLSDTQLGISPLKQYSTALFRTNKVAEKYRSTQGTGIGPKYHQLSDGRLVRPGTFGTKLRPLLEPGETVEWEKLPSYYHWYPKETLHDYIENTTWREVKGRKTDDLMDARLERTLKGADVPTKGKHELPRAELMPWDSATLPITKFNHERNEGEIVVEDAKTGRIIGMDRATYERFKVMMKERREGKPESDPVEFDQERFVTNRDGVVFDLSKISYRPIFDGRWNRNRPGSTGKGGTRVMV